MKEMRPTTLYRVFGSANQLLYVGISIDVGERLTQHASRTGWWVEAATLSNASGHAFPRQLQLLNAPSAPRPKKRRESQPKFKLAEFIQELNANEPLRRLAVSICTSDSIARLAALGMNVLPNEASA